VGATTGAFVGTVTTGAFVGTVTTGAFVGTAATGAFVGTAATGAFVGGATTVAGRTQRLPLTLTNPASQAQSLNFLGQLLVGRDLSGHSKQVWCQTRCEILEYGE
jgi:hypothetical protein